MYQDVPALCVGKDEITICILLGFNLLKWTSGDTFFLIILELPTDIF